MSAFWVGDGRILSMMTTRNGIGVSRPPGLSIKTLTSLTVGAFISIKTSAQIVTNAFKTGGSIETRVTGTLKNFCKVKK